MFITSFGWSLSFMVFGLRSPHSFEPRLSVVGAHFGNETANLPCHVRRSFGFLSTVHTMVKHLSEFFTPPCPRWVTYQTHHTDKDVEATALYFCSVDEDVAAMSLDECGVRSLGGNANFLQLEGLPPNPHAVAIHTVMVQMETATDADANRN